MMTIRQQVLNFLQAHSVVRPKDLVECGLPKDYLYTLAKEGVIIRVGRGLYQWPEKDLGRYQSLSEVCKRAPNAVITLLSALNYHNFTTQNPYQVWLAIGQKSWRPKISYPPVRIITMSGEAMTSGIDEIMVEGVSIKVFNPAKTVADCFKYRNKIGLDVALDALKEGWATNKFTMDELYHYAKICRVKKIMQPYIESLV